MQGRTDQIRDAIRTVNELDARWMREPAGHDDPRSTPWMPFPWPDFTALVGEALPESAGDSFLEIGCGIGTRMLLAREIYGLDVAGIERVPEYAEQARQLGLTVSCEDALGHKGYGLDWDLIWFNRPFRDPGLERQLEAQVWEDAAPGTVIIMANIEQPPSQGWYLILDDGELRRWIMQKLPA